MHAITEKQKTMSHSKIVQEGLTYDDVLLIPAYSNVLPNAVTLESKVTKNISINTPILSAAMDTVTESELAIAIAQQGGIGIIHKNMTAKQQAKEVRKVKRSESGMITDPVTLNEDATVGDALNLMAEFKIGGIPIVDKNLTLKGIVTNRDLRFEKEKGKKITDVMTSKDLVTAVNEITLVQAEKILQQHKIEKLLIVNESNKLTGLITYRDI